MALSIKEKRKSVFDHHASISGLSFCLYCKNLLSLSDRECVGFTKLIPDEIWQGKNDHSEPYPGDNGVQFEPIK